MNTKKWERRTMTLILVIKGKRILLGQAHKGDIAGFLTPPGGKVEKSDKNIKEAAIRELREETGYQAREIYKVATVRIQIRKKRKTIRLHVYKCKSWTGNLKLEAREFSYLKFIPISKIPWEKTVPGDKDWMVPVLEGQRLSVTMICNKNRMDSFFTYIRGLP
jgi:8-oxo-dGTP pyrophosphatase MutT (NUDIX family)